MNLRVTFDQECDAAYIRLRASDAGHGQTVEAVPDEVFLDFDSVGHLVGIEVLHASDVLPAELLASAESYSDSAAE